MRTIGKYTYISGKEIIIFEDQANLIIGKFCSIAGGLTVFLGGNHRSDWISTFPFGHRNQKIFSKYNGEGVPKTNGDVIIGNDVWIGRNVTIMSGVKIGDGAIIGSNSHVIQKVKPYSVVGGNPAQFYYYRFNQEIIKKLLKLKWWDFDDDIINDISPILCSGNFDLLFDFCEKFKK